MKNQLVKFSIKILPLTIVVILFVSCAKNNDGDQSGAGSMSLKVDGTSWEASLAVQGVYSSGVFSVTGSDSNAKQVNITVLNPEVGKTYSTGGLANYSNMGRWTAGLDPSQTYSTAAVTSVSGEIKIIAFSDTSAEGTFSFKARNTSQEEVNVTEGKFTVNF